MVTYHYASVDAGDGSITVTSTDQTIIESTKRALQEICSKPEGRLEEDGYELPGGGSWGYFWVMPSRGDWKGKGNALAILILRHLCLSGWEPFSVTRGEKRDRIAQLETIHLRLRVESEEETQGLG